MQKNPLKEKFKKLRVGGVPLRVPTKKDRANCFNFATSFNYSIETAAVRDGYEIRRTK